MPRVPKDQCSRCGSKGEIAPSGLCKGCINETILVLDINDLVDLRVRHTWRPHLK